MSKVAGWQELFPPYGCTRDQAQSRFRLDPDFSVSGSKVCFIARTVPCERPGSACCKSDVDFYKLELSVKTGCKFGVRSVTVNGKPTLAPTFELYGAADDKALIKMPGKHMQ